MIDDHHLSDDTIQYENWDSARVLEFLKVHGCRRLNMLREIEEQRHIALAETVKQQEFLVRLAHELKGDNAGAADGGRWPPVPIDSQAATAGAPDPYEKLDAIDRASVRDATNTLFSINNVIAERYGEHKQSAPENHGQDQQAPAHPPEGADA